MSCPSHTHTNLIYFESKSTNKYTLDNLKCYNTLYIKHRHRINTGYLTVQAFLVIPHKRISGGYIEITLSVRLFVLLSVQIRVRPTTFFCIGLAYLAHGCITMRRCVAYIHDPDTTLNFDLKVKFIGFMT